MRLSSKLLVAGFALAASLFAGVAADLLFDDGHLLSLAAGQAGVEEACLPELKRTLSQRGFLPNDIEFGQKPGLALLHRSTRTFNSDFTFQDGPEARRIDGIMACEVSRSDVRVDVRTDSRPVRAT